MHNDSFGDEGGVTINEEGTTEFHLKYNAFISDKSPTTDLALRNHIDKGTFDRQMTETKKKVKKQKDFIQRMKTKISELDDAIYFNTTPTEL